MKSQRDYILQNDEHLLTSTRWNEELYFQNHLILVSVMFDNVFIP